MTSEAAYRERLDRATGRERRLAGRSRALSYARGAVFAAGVAAAAVVVWQAAAPGLAAPVALGAAAAAFLVLVVVHDRVLRRQRREAERARINREALARLGREWDRLPLPRLPEVGQDGPAARDLDLFGRASLFHLLATAWTPPGRTALARWLLAPAAPEEVGRRQAAVRELAPRLELRQSLELVARKLEAADPDPEPFLRWAEGEPWLLARPWLLWAVRLSAAASLGLFFAGAFRLLPLSAWGLLLLAHFVAGRLWGGPAAETFARVEAREAGFAAYGEALELLAHQRFASPLLAELAAELAAGGLAAPYWLRRLDFLVGLAQARRTGGVHFLLQVTLLWDFHVLALLEGWQRRAGRHARRWLAALGEIEALAALAGLAGDNPDWAFARLDGGGAATVEARGLAHPLLPPDRRVGNDLTVGPPGTVLLVTGSNMSGKSTLLRALGVNAVLAQAGGPVCARSLALPPLELGTSVLVEDSLAGGVSYFLAELKRLQGIVARADSCRREGDRRLLFLLDEVLRGTNAAERRVAVTRVLRHLVARGAIGAVATHDLELAGEPELAAVLHPVHFRETVHPGPEGPPMTFDYRLRPGLATTTNALRLLALMGLGGEPEGG